MRIPDILSASDRTRFSLEVFPPKTRARGRGAFQKHLSRIFDTIETLAKHDPAFISVTYNPENLTRATSIPLAAIIKERYGIETLPHLTCINTPPGELRRTLDVLGYFGLENIMALRGDQTPGAPRAPLCFDHACDLVHEIRSGAPTLSVAVACYPEGHPECVDAEGRRDLDADLRHLVHKVGQGADLAITQLFLDNGHFFRLVERARAAGVEVPIVPGIMPMTSADNMRVARSLTGVHVPEGLERAFAEHRDEPEELLATGVEHAIRQCKGLMGRVPCIHFYTMDTWEATDRIVRALG